MRHSVNNIDAKINGSKISAQIYSADIIFWDFDGTIKDSLEVKAKAFEVLFKSFGCKILMKIRDHHENHEGMSRFEKIPLYLSWTHQTPDSTLVKKYCDEFSDMVIRSVINSPWVPGVYEYLKFNHSRQCFVLITATPQKEIEIILKGLDILDFFKEIHGSPKQKKYIISDVLSRMKCNPDKALVVGDSEVDYYAANENLVPFLLRGTRLNRHVQSKIPNQIFESLNFE